VCDTEFFVPLPKTLQAIHTMKRRCKFDIIVVILDAISGGATKTKIVHAANLNFTLAGKYLSFLQERGLVEKHDGCYKVTREGAEYLKKAKELRIWVTGPAWLVIAMTDL